MNTSLGLAALSGAFFHSAPDAAASGESSHRQFLS